eukprot:scaffold683_cov423-Prasinococcus_capsulatus_cf.AAC.12
MIPLPLSKPSGRAARQRGSDVEGRGTRGAAGSRSAAPPTTTAAAAAAAPRAGSTQPLFAYMYSSFGGAHAGSGSCPPSTCR